MKSLQNWLGIILLTIGCSSSSKNALEETFPTDLAITSPFATENAVEGLVKRNPYRSVTAPDTISVVTFDSKKTGIVERIGATDINKCGFDVQLFSNVPQVSCYGPVIN